MQASELYEYMASRLQKYFKVVFNLVYFEKKNIMNPKMFFNCNESHYLYFMHLNTFFLRRGPWGSPDSQRGP